VSCILRFDTTLTPSPDRWPDLPHSRHREAGEPSRRDRLVSAIHYDHKHAESVIDGSTAISIGFIIVTWQVNNYICSAVCICMIGFFLAPIFPAAIVLITDIFPDELHVGVIGLFGTLGGAGAAATPFVLGALADKVSLGKM